MKHLLFLFSALVLVGAGCVNDAVAPPAPVTETPTSSEEETATQADPSAPSAEAAVYTYRDDVLQIAFEYPARWGTLAHIDERGLTRAQEPWPQNPDGTLVTDCLALRSYTMRVGERQQIVGSAKTTRPCSTLGRGAFFGDQDVSTPEKAQAWCERAESCEQLTNPQGMAIWHAQFTPQSIGEEPIHEYVILLSQKTPFHALHLSTQRIGEAEDSALEALVMSLRVSS